MKRSLIILCLLMSSFAFIIISSCSKSSGGNSSGNTTVTSIFPLALNNTWNYKLKNYNTTTGTVTDSSFFTLSIIGKFSANGATYYQFQNGVDTTVIQTLTAINNNTLGSIDSAFGVSYYTSFISGSGDSTQTAASWPVSVFNNGAFCQGTDKLFAHYADTTLVNIDGLTYTNSIKNNVITYDCSGNKLLANVYFIKDGVGLVRFSRYIYNSAGKPLLALAWVLESQTLVTGN
jgi:hypothetical protein